MEDNYSPNDLSMISAEKQKTIHRSVLGIFGNNFAGEIATINLIGLGVREIYIIGKEEKRNFTDDFLSKNNPSQSVITYNDISLSDFLSDGKVDYNSIEDFCEDEFITDYIICNGNTLVDKIKSCVTIDNFRKKYAPLDEYDLPEMHLHIHDLTKKVPRRKVENVLAIGAGGIGNYFVIGSIGKDYTTRLVDHDTFEEKNACRQIYCRPGKKKVDVIAEHTKNVEPCSEYFDESLIKTFDKEGYEPDVVIGCVDNAETRNLLIKYSSEREIPYFDGGVGFTDGQVIYNPTPFKNRLVKHIKDNSCIYKPNPSVIIPNCLMGLYLSEAAEFDLSKHAKLNFSFNSLSPNRITEKYYDTTT